MPEQVRGTNQPQKVASFSIAVDLSEVSLPDAKQFNADVMDALEAANPEGISIGRINERIVDVDGSKVFLHECFFNSEVNAGDLREIVEKFRSQQNGR